MAALLSRPCFISLHVPYRQGWTQDLATIFRFQPVAVRETPQVRQLALRRGSAVFLVNERLVPGLTGASCDFLYDVDRPPWGTASNVCFEVDDVRGLCKQLQNRGCSLPVPPTEVRDDNGSVTYGVVSSIVGNISHTLLDRSRYRGPFLPCFQPIHGAPSATGDGIEITHFDHIAYVCPRGSARVALDWYQRCFGAGIQHVGLCTTDIIATTRALQQRGARFFTPPATYYSQGGKAEEIRGAGQDPCMLAELGILLDTIAPGDKGQPGTDAAESPSQGYLMQIFTHPIFSEETFFLELIYRQGALGFGEGNIRALWNAVQ
ncbi:4-hydroxyphenylpyruvate dioxygenase-like, partial [Podiceps cristatus]